jgi:hypothetical protein
MDSAFPRELWGTVRSQPAGSDVQRVRISGGGSGGGYLIITEEGGRVFDVWVETEADVADYLDTLAIEWDEAGGPAT